MTLEPSLFYAGGGVLANTLSCGAAGSTFGPVGTAAGLVIGGLVAVGACCYFGEWDRVWYQLKYDIGQVAQVFAIVKAYFEDNPGSHKDGECESINDAQAPGKPSAGDGYKPPKNWDVKKVKHRRGWGYPDKDGNIWIPSGPKGHGGPHWDVQYARGGYDNVVPGGRIRGLK